MHIPNQLYWHLYPMVMRIDEEAHPGLGLGAVVGADVKLCAPVDFQEWKSA